ncbi:uridine kinase family protein [Streptomyces xiaopingdaonensis]|uniref:uridine kinase family protein n=1 Tax=Streptomyces xiaopingdaonensis TaxID=1565415 RepID=UPI000318A008|nr:AAA family ATPase [Streptomyces xiaopingdaonensis]
MRQHEPGESRWEQSAAGRPLSLDGLAERLRRLPPSCGPVRLVGVDGHAGSGKSTFAAVLADRLGGAPVVHLDDLSSHDAFFAWTGRLREHVLEPLSRAEPARYDVYDWVGRRFVPGGEVLPAPVVLLEGVGAGRREVRPRLAALVWLELPAEESWRRGRERDGEELAGFWNEWETAERAHFAADPSRPHAQVLVFQGQYGHGLLPGPAGGA